MGGPGLFVPGLAQVEEGLLAGVLGDITQLLLDAEQLVVLGHPVGAAGGAGFDLGGVHRHHDIGNGHVLGLAGAVGDDGGVPRPVGLLDGVQRLDRKSTRLNSSHIATSRMPSSA